MDNVTFAKAMRQCATSKCLVIEVFAKCHIYTCTVAGAAVDDVTDPTDKVNVGLLT